MSRNKHAKHLKIQNPSEPFRLYFTFFKGTHRKYISFESIYQKLSEFNSLLQIDYKIGKSTRKTNVLTNFVLHYSLKHFSILKIRFNGPPSETLTFNTPEGVPGTVLSLEAFPMGSSAFFLKWTKPAEPNGILTGYRIYYQVVNGTKLEPELERRPKVTDPLAVSAKLASLKPETKYRIHIRATTNAGEGNK